jgi:hypothetical protein
MTKIISNNASRQCRRRKRLMSGVEQQAVESAVDVEQYQNRADGSCSDYRCSQGPVLMPSNTPSQRSKAQCEPPCNVWISFLARTAMASNLKKRAVAG